MAGMEKASPLATDELGFQGLSRQRPPCSAVQTLFFFLLRSTKSFFKLITKLLYKVTPEGSQLLSLMMGIKKK